LFGSSLAPVSFSDSRFRSQGAGFAHRVTDPLQHEIQHRAHSGVAERGKGRVGHNDGAEATRHCRIFGKLDQEPAIILLLARAYNMARPSQKARAIA